MRALFVMAWFSLVSVPVRADPKVVGYFTEWSVYQRDYHVRNIPAERLTHINYAFARIVNGECTLFDSYAAIDKAYPGDKQEPGVLRGNFHQLQLLKKKHPHLKTLISVGGWTLSSPFSDLALTEAGRVKFTRSCVAFIRKYGFDGVDVDWEYPVGGGLEGNKNRKEDRTNYTLLLEEMRKQLDDAGKEDKRAYLLTIAAPAGPRNIANFELDRMHRSLDWINLMAYDFHGSWDASTHLNAPLRAIKNDPAQDALSRRLNVAAAVETYLAAGIPPDKLVLGVPFYGRGWGGVGGENNGLFQPKKNIPKGTWEDGVFDYKDLARNHVGKFTRYWHGEAEVPWLHDARSGLMISYDDPQSLRIKAEFAKTNKLGGIMCWELSADTADSALLKAIQEGLKK